MHIQRLQQLREIVSCFVDAPLANCLVKLNGEFRRWNMNFWDCGTGACAWGSYVLSTYGKADGLVFEYYDEDKPESVKGLAYQINNIAPIEVAAEYFDIRGDTATSLFHPSGYQDVLTGEIEPQDVLNRIDFLLGVGEEEFLKKFE